MKKRKNYKFTNKKNSNGAVMAVILGVISLVSLVAAVLAAYGNAGETAVKYGFAGLFAALLSLVGLVLGIAAAQDKDCYKFFPVLGILLNFLALALVVLILYAGANL